MTGQVGVIRTFPHKLSDEELVDRAKRAGVYRHELSVLVNDFDEAKRKAKSQIELKEQELNHMLHVVQTGVEEKTELCKVEIDYDRGVKEFYWNGVHVDTEPLRPEERQMSL